MRTKWLWTGAVVLGVLSALVLVQLQNNSVYFYTPSEALASTELQDGRRLQIGGMVKDGSLSGELTDGVSFVLTDFKKEINIFYKGALPNNFGEGKGAVVEGRFAGTEFKPTTVLWKHDQNYQVPHDGKNMDRGLLMKSLEIGASK